MAAADPSVPSSISEAAVFAGKVAAAATVAIPAGKGSSIRSTICGGSYGLPLRVPSISFSSSSSSDNSNVIGGSFRPFVVATVPQAKAMTAAVAAGDFGGSFFRPAADAASESTARLLVLL